MIKTQLFGEQLFTIGNLLSFHECQEIINRANQKGWNKSSPSGGGHGRIGNEDPRTNKFSIFHDELLSEKIWNNIELYIPKNIDFLGENVYFNTHTKGREWKPKFIYNKMRIYKYDIGDVFPEHIDYKVKRHIIKDEKEYIQQSFLTLLIYLNDNIEGGKTGYWPNHCGIHCRFLRNVEKQQSKKEHQVIITPKTGLGVIQDQNILHEALPPTKGIKYILRTDIICEREVIRDKRVQIDLSKNKINEWERLFESSCKNYAD